MVEIDRNQGIPNLVDWSFEANEAVATVEMRIGGKLRQIEIKVASSEPGNLTEVLEAFQRNNYEALEQLANQFLDQNNHSVSVVLSADQGEVKTENEGLVKTSNNARKISTQVLHQESVNEVRKKAVNRVYQHLMSCLPRSSGLINKPLTVTLIIGDKASESKWRHTESITSSFNSIVAAKPAMPSRAPPAAPVKKAKPAMPKRTPPPRPLTPNQESEKEKLLDESSSSDAVIIEAEKPKEKERIERITSTFRRAAKSVVKKGGDSPVLKPVMERANSDLALNRRDSKDSTPSLSVADYAKAVINFPLAALAQILFLPLKLFKWIQAPPDLSPVTHTNWNPKMGALKPIAKVFNPLKEATLTAYNATLKPVNALFKAYRENSFTSKAFWPVFNAVVARPFFLVASLSAALLCAVNAALWGSLLLPRLAINGAIRLIGAHPPTKSPLIKAIGDRVNTMVSSVGAYTGQAGVIFANMLPVAAWKAKLLDDLLATQGKGIIADAGKRQSMMVNKYTKKATQPRQGAIYSYFVLQGANKGLIGFYNDFKGEVKIKTPPDNRV